MNDVVYGRAEGTAADAARLLWAGIVAAVSRLRDGGRVRIVADPVEMVLHGERPLRLVRARGRRVVCTSGCVWIAVPGMADDIFLHRGEHWRIHGNGVVLVEAVGDATVIVERCR